MSRNLEHYNPNPNTTTAHHGSSQNLWLAMRLFQIIFQYHLAWRSKMYWKSARFVPFGVNVTHFEAKSEIHATDSVIWHRETGIIPSQWLTYFLILWYQYYLGFVFVCFWFLFFALKTSSFVLTIYHLTKERLYYLNLRFLNSLKSYINDIYIILNLVQFPKYQ